MRALVTGGAGFIGSHLVDALIASLDDDVAILDDYSTGTYEPDCLIYRGDVRYPERAIDDVRPEVVFHLAAQADVRRSLERPGHDADVNVGGTVAVLEAARLHGADVVLASTGGAIYGECSVPASEGSPARPLAPYGASKLSAEAYLATWNRLYGTQHTALRLGNVYGPRQNPHGEAGVVAIFAGALLAGSPATIFGDGGQTRDFVYVDDVVRAFLTAPGREGVFNIGTGDASSVLDVYAGLCRLAGRRARRHEFAPARPGELYRSVLDPTLARLELGWSAETTLEDGLAATWASLGGARAA